MWYVGIFYNSFPNSSNCSSKLIIYILSIHKHNNIRWYLHTVIIFILQMRKLWLSEIKWLTQDHKALKCLRTDSNLSLPDSESPLWYAVINNSHRDIFIIRKHCVYTYMCMYTCVCVCVCVLEFHEETWENQTLRNARMLLQWSEMGRWGI